MAASSSLFICESWKMALAMKPTRFLQRTCLEARAMKFSLALLFPSVSWWVASSSLRALMVLVMALELEYSWERHSLQLFSR